MHVVAERKETKREAIKYRIFTGLLSLLVVTGGGAALAQTAPAASTKGKTEEITVTAQNLNPRNIQKPRLGSALRIDITCGQRHIIKVQRNSSRACLARDTAQFQG